ncbi:hypothetical protein ACFL5V_11525 [Fibrobacterota bacterium]
MEEAGLWLEYPHSIPSSLSCHISWPKVLNGIARKTTGSRNNDFEDLIFISLKAAREDHPIYWIVLINSS